MIVVYVSGALTAPTYAQRCRNARRIQRKALELTGLGYAVIVPGWDVWLEPAVLSWRRWMAADCELLSRADVVYALPERAVRPSRGRAREIAEAQRIGVPVVYSNAELRAVARALRRTRAVA